MAVAHSLGFPHIGAGRELKKALEAYGKGEMSETSLRQIAQDLRATHWQLQTAAGIDLLPVGDFTWSDQVLTHALMFGVVPDRFLAAEGQPTLDTLVAMAQDANHGSGSGTQAQETAEWFDTDHRCLVPEFTVDQQFSLSWSQLFDEVEQATALGHRVKPMLIGPLTFLWLGKVKGEPFDKLDLLEPLLPVYGEILERLAAQGVEWVQIDEPVLGLDLPQDWKNAFERAYNLLQRAPLKKLIATYFGGLNDNLGLAATLPVDGLHIDLVCAPDQYPVILDRLPTYKVLSLGLVDGRNAQRCDLAKALDLLEHAAERLGERLWIAPSCPVLQAQVDLDREDQPAAEQEGWLALAIQKYTEVAVLARAINQPDDLIVQAALPHPRPGLCGSLGFG